MQFDTMNVDQDHDENQEPDDGAEIVRRAHEFFERVTSADNESREARRKDLRFCALGDQWPGWAKRDRSEPGRERPMLVINRTKQFVTRAINSYLESLPSIKCRPIDDQADPDTAEAVQEIVRHIQYRSKADQAYGMAIEPQMREGLGFCRVSTRYADDDGFDQEIVILPIPNPFKVYFDPDAQMPDGSDGRKCIIAEEMTREDFEAQYPGVDPGSNSWVGAGDSRGWDTKERVRVAEYFEVITDRQGELLMLEDGSVIPSEQHDGMTPVIARRQREQKRCLWHKIAGSTVIESREMPCSMLPVVRFAGSMVVVDGKLSFHGMVRDLESPQIQYNYQQSAMTELVGLQPIAPYITAYGQTEDFEGEWSQANRVPLTRLRYKPVTVAGNLAAPPERQPFAQIPNGSFNLLQLAIDDMKAVTGQFNASQGSADETDQSGRAILAQQRMGDTSLAHYAIHANQAIEQLGRVILDMIPKVYTRPMLFRILGEDGAQKQIAIDPGQQQAAMPVQGGPIEAIYNPGVGKYDIAITTGPSFQTRRAESAAMLMDLAGRVPQLMQVAGDLVVGSLDSPVASKIADRLRPPGLEDETQDPQVAALTQQLQQMQAQLEQMQAALESKEEEAEIKRFDALTNRLKVILPAAQQADQMAAQQEAAIMAEPLPDTDEQEQQQQEMMQPGQEEMMQ